jgi:predicted nucleic-acid-binding Zn-ribbon protein
MRTTQTCPKCSGKKFAVTDEFRQPDYDSSNVTRPFSAITIPTGSSSRGKCSYEGRKALGQFETWICVVCGYTEFYAYGLDDIEHVAKQYPDHLRIVDATPRGQGPFR